MSSPAISRPSLAADVPERSDAQIRRVIIAASLGNALEWFDLVVYGFFAATISRLFFPSTDETVSLMLALGTFGVSYLIRPVGALVLGAYADRVGRKAALLASIVLMTIGTFLIAVMPTYGTIGVWAPIGMLLARLIQGFSVGGEFGSSTALLVETAPQRRGFMSSWQYASQGLTTLVAASFGALLTSLLTTSQLDAWGWRIPFFFGLLIGPIGFYIRRHIDDGQEFKQAIGSRSPLLDLWHEQKLRVLLAVGALLISTSVNYLILYMPTYAVKQLGLPASSSFAATMVTGLALTILPPFIGHWSDRVGRLRIMAFAGSLMMLTAYPAFLVLNGHASFTVMMLMMVWLGALKACYSGVLPALMSEIFPTETRASGLSISYNIAVTIFGGFAPLIITWLITATGDKLAPSYYLIGCAFASLIALLAIRKHLALK
ncbi:MFS transporter [Variovorax paradoxus]|jgi:MHS family proline/betaine transporter-like MFS transporter|uniref:MFS transporter n=1 Tax=Variovorax paradoxus TaxID=34073 RepID=UPI0004169EF0